MLSPTERPPRVTRHLRRAAIAAALIVTPLTSAAMFLSTSATTVTASATSLVAPAEHGTPTAGTQVSFTDVKYTKKKKKKTTAAAKAATKPATRKPATKPVTESGTDVFATMEAQVITLTNQQRAANGCGALRADARLTAAARAHSTDMVTNNFFSHTGSNGSDFVAREKAAGYTAASAENIAWGQKTPEAVMDAWMNSAGHRANILNCGSVAVGVGLAYTAGGSAYWTQDFGRM
jgi:uncharacterized protein YkwD